jgi:predicted transposase YdaD
MEMRKKLTLEQVIENTGLGAKWEARGEVKGEARGMKKGLSEGHTEEKREIARKMKQAERPFSEIAEFTGLSPKAIQKL